MGAHILENMGNLSGRTKKTPEEIKEVADREYPKYARVKDAFSFGVEARNRVRDAKNQYEERRKESSNELHSNGYNSASECVGTYSVSGYTRPDGTQVSGYTRTCGAKHGR